jgi:hypothetical protein
MLARAAICFILLFFTGAAFADGAKNRVALVIGNSAYQRKALANPVNDAKLMAQRLEAQGFDVFPSYDAGQREMKHAVQGFAAILRTRGRDVVAFVFYAGHGVQVKGENYLIPVDEQIKGEADVDNESVRVSWILSILKEAQTRLAIVVLDACRDNPFGYARGGQRGLAGVDAPRGSLIAFSTAPNEVASDGKEGGNSYYTAALARWIAEPGLKIEDVFKKVRVEVDAKTEGEQTPWESTSLKGDFYPAGERGAVPALLAQTVPPPARPHRAVAAKLEPQPEPQYEEKEERLIRTFANYPHAVHSGVFSPDGRTALSGSHDKTLKLWDIASGRELRSFKGHTNSVASVAFSPDGRMALSGSSDTTLRLWDITEWTQPLEARR